MFKMSLWMVTFFPAAPLTLAVTQHRVKYVCNALLFLIKGSHKASLLLNITKWGLQTQCHPEC